jgi:serine protease
VEIVAARLETAAGHLLARIRADASVDEILAALTPSGVVGVRPMAAGRWVRVDLAEATPGSLPEALAEMQANTALFEAVEPDFVVRTCATNPNDPYWLSGDLWGLRNTGQSGGLADADIDADEAWDTRTDSSGVVVAVIDTGILATHEDLAANMWINPGEVPGDGLDNDSNGVVDDVFGFNAIDGSGNPADDHGHGTHVAGTIGARGNNGLGVVGVTWRTRLLAAKFISSSGSGWTSDAVEVIDYARLAGARVMNNSWGGTGYSQSLADAIERTRQAGIVFVAAAGNESTSSDSSPFYPSCYPHDNILSVAATTRTDDLASFSNRGIRTVDIAAPGVEILSCGSSSDSSYAYMSGTSMATPHGSGAVALVRSQFPAATPAEVIERLLATADHPTPLALRGTSRNVVGRG